MERAPVTRQLLARRLVVSAATRPLNVGVGVAVLVAALVLGSVWLIPVAIAVYLGMVVSTLFDGDRAEEVGRLTYVEKRPQLAEIELRPFMADEVTRKVGLARDQERRLRKAIAEAAFPVHGLEHEADGLMQALDNLARRADEIYEYLGGEEESTIRERLERLRSVPSGDAAVDGANAQAVVALEEQLAVRDQLGRQLLRFDAQMEHITATLGAINAQVVRMSVEEEAAAQSRVAEQVRDLRSEVTAAADGMQEAYRELGE
jgi:hypothetical protein